MPDSSSASSLPPDPAAAPDLSVVPSEPKRRSPSLLNQAQQREIQRVKQLVRTAKTPAYLSLLQAREITPLFLDKLQMDVENLEKRITAAISCTHKKEGATLDEQVAESDLITDLRVAQAAARQKYFHSNPAKLQDYFIGERIDANRATLDQAAQAIVTKMNEERPPGVDTVFINQVEARRQKVTTANTTQGTEQGLAKTARELRDAEVKSIKERGQKIQFAADAAWPAGVTGNGGIRRQFLLPIRRPFTG